MRAPAPGSAARAPSWHRVRALLLWLLLTTAARARFSAGLAESAGRDMHEPGANLGCSPACCLFTGHQTVTVGLSVSQSVGQASNQNRGRKDAEGEQKRWQHRAEQQGRHEAATRLQGSQLREHLSTHCCQLHHTRKAGMAVPSSACGCAGTQPPSQRKASGLRLELRCARI